MNKTTRHIVSYLLLLCITATLIPINLFHQHEESLHCDITNIDAESDPCHISIYHVQDVTHSCEHKSHINEVEDKCNFCKFLTPRRDQFVTVWYYENTIAPILISEDFLIKQESFIQQNFSNSILGRAPPTC